MASFYPAVLKHTSVLVSPTIIKGKIKKKGKCIVSEVVSDGRFTVIL